MTDFRNLFNGTGRLTDIVLFARLNAQEQRELQGRMEKKQMKEFMTVSPAPICACTYAHYGISIMVFRLGSAHHAQIDVFEAGPEML